MKITRTEVTVQSVEELKGILSTLESGVLVFLEHVIEQELQAEPEADSAQEEDDHVILNFNGILDA